MGIKKKKIEFVFVKNFIFYFLFLSWHNQYTVGYNVYLKKTRVPADVVYLTPSVGQIGVFS